MTQEEEPNQDRQPYYDRRQRISEALDNVIIAFNKWNTGKRAKPFTYHQEDAK